MVHDLICCPDIRKDFVFYRVVKVAHVNFDKSGGRMVGVVKIDCVNADNNLFRVYRDLVPYFRKVTKNAFLGDRRFRVDARSGLKDLKLFLDFLKLESQKDLEIRKLSSYVCYRDMIRFKDAFLVKRLVERNVSECLLGERNLGLWNRFVKEESFVEEFVIRLPYQDDYILQVYYERMVVAESFVAYLNTGEWKRHKFVEDVLNYYHFQEWDVYDGRSYNFRTVRPDMDAFVVFLNDLAKVVNSNDISFDEYIDNKIDKLRCVDLNDWLKTITEKKRDEL